MTVPTLDHPAEPTTNTLLAEMFNRQPLIPIEQICEVFLGLSVTTAKRKARLDELPFPAFRLGGSQKSPWVVSFDELVNYVERVAKLATNDWERAQV